MLSILAVGRDERLLDTRAAVLRRTTAEVTQARPELAVFLLPAMRFDVVILCHGLSLEESTELTNLAHRSHSGVYVMQLITGALWGENYEAAPVDEVLEADPDRLVERVIVLSKRKTEVPMKQAVVLKFRTASDAAH